uniref:Inositol-3-phosphate synthase n=1 Tax=Glycine max TaxID=3847 RepID=K7LCR0_SOYBN
GDYEYIDVNFKGKRYIVEVSLAGKFEIARPTYQYSSLVDVFPLIFVGKVVRLMCTALKGSMKRMNLHIPPWRRNMYMQAKWLSAYKHTTNAVATKRASLSLSSNESLFPKRSMGFEVRPVKAHNCKDVYAINTGFRIGHWTVVLNSDNLGA